MTDISARTLSAITQALSQLKPSTGNSDLTGQSVAVIVKHESNQFVSLSPASSANAAKYKPVLLPAAQVTGKLLEGQPHQIRIVNSPQPALEFFPVGDPSSSKTIPLNEQQISSLLTIAPKQLVANSQLSKVDLLKVLAQLNATLVNLPQGSHGLATPPTSQSNIDLLSLTQGQLTPRVSSQPKHSQIALKITDLSPPINILLPVKHGQSMSIADKISLAIVPKGVNWQVNVTIQPPANDLTKGTNTTQPVGNKIQDPLVIPRPNTLPLAGQSAANRSAHSLQKLINLVISPDIALPIIKAVLMELAKSQPLALELPLNPLLTHLSKSSVPQDVALVAQLQKGIEQNPKLLVASSGKIELQLGSDQPAAQLLLTKALAQNLSALKIPGHQAVLNQLQQANQPLALAQASSGQNTPQPIVNNQAGGQPTVISAADQKALQKLANPLVNAIREHITATGDTKLPQINIKLEQASLVQGLAALVQTKTSHQSSLQAVQKDLSEWLSNNRQAGFPSHIKQAAAELSLALQQNIDKIAGVNPHQLTSKAEQSSVIQQLMRVVQAKAETPAGPLQNIQKALLDLDAFKGSPELPTKVLIEQVAQQISQALPQGKEQDAAQLRQLLSLPALAIGPLQLTAPSTGQGLLGGLVTLLQVSLAARLARNQTSRADQITQVLSRVVGGSGKVKQSVSPKALNEFSQLEQKHQLMREIGRLLSGHQSSKLANAEQMLQGQETFHYNIPCALGGSIRDIEILIKRENDHQHQQSNDAGDTKAWQLTMKLAVGELGELLTKAKLRPDNLEINFYASNPGVQQQVMNYLPLLKRKLESLGITLAKSQCQLGKIPDSLQDRPYQVFQAKA